MNKIAMYPGCSLEGTSASYLVSIEKVLNALGTPCPTLDNWNCCGATSAHAMDHGLYLGLAAKNLALAESQGFAEVLAPCASCYHRLASAQNEFERHPETKEAVRAAAGIEYSGGVKVRNVLDFLANVIGTNRIAKKVVRPLAGLKVASYYGCLNTRIPHMRPFDDIANPTSMDRIVETLGAEPLDWFHKTECCGASLFVTSESTAYRLVSKILKDAVARGADCICVACPMCHNNLDTKQEAIRLANGIERPLPVLFVSQLMGLSFGMSASELRVQDHFVSADSLECVAS